ncbi:MAG TPA: TonB-dependent receptor [Gemmatimonadales bacterium]|nr:TonB-dependent receptor [Gemmatimonadales bacterium]
MAPRLVRPLVVLLLTPALLRAQTPDSTRRDTTARATPMSSGARITRAHLDSLPLDDPATAFAQIPGVFLRGSDVGILPGGALSIRGGNAAATFIDGAPVRSFLTGTAFIQPALNGIADIEVTTGLGGAGLSDIQNGIISYLTPSGADRFQSHWSAHTDNPFGSVASVGYNRFTGDVSGPIPGVVGLTFFASGLVEGQSSEYLGFGAQNVPTFVVGGVDTVVQVSSGSGTQPVTIPKFVQVSGSCDAGQNGAACQGITRPFDWRTGLQFQGKVRWAYGEGSSVSITGLADGLQLRQAPGASLGDPALFSGAHEWTRLAVLNWHHRFGATLAVDAVMSVGSDNAIAGALDPSSETATRDPSLGIELSPLRFSEFGGLRLPLDDQIVKNVRTNSGLRVPLEGQNQLDNLQPYRMNPYAMASGGFFTAGANAPLAMASEHRRTGRWQVEWTPAPGHAVRVGLDADGADLTNYDAASPINQTFLDAWTASPRRLGWFGEDVMSFGSASLEVGIRYDRVNPGVLLPSTPGFIFNSPLWDQSLTSTSPAAAYAAAVSKVFVPTQDQSFVTPRVRFGWQIDEATSVRASFGQTVMPPPVGLVASNSNTDLTNTNANTLFGRDVKDGLPWTSEAGARRQFGAAMSADLSVYYDFHIPSYAGLIQNYDDPTNPGRQLSLGVLGRINDAYVWGVDATLAHTFGHVVSAAASYGISMNGFENVAPIVITPGGGGPSVVITAPTTTTQELSASLHAVVPEDWAADGWKRVFRNVGAVVLFRAISGIPYTPLINVGGGEVAPGENFGFGATQAGGINSQSLPWTKVLDLQLTKGIRANGLDWTIFADFRNLLSIKNLYAQYAETNGPTNGLFEANITSSEFVILENEASNNGALMAGGAVSLSNCGSWTASNTGPVDCVMLRRAEARFGNGDGTYTLAEQQNALNAYFNMVYGAYRFYGPQRTVRVGLKLAL